MNIVLLVVTAVSVLAAVIMAAMAWRLSREARSRSQARIAALAAAAANEDEPAWAPASRVTPAAPVSAPRLQRPVAPWAPPRTAAPLGESFLGSSVANTPQTGQRRLAVAAGVLFLLAIAGGYFVLFGGSAARSNESLTGRDTRPPLELVSLRHERQNTRLAITGTVRNPSDGGAVERLSAVASLFDQQGALLSTARAEVDYTRLVPGEESPFVITADASPDVARYRVSFRTEAGVVPHVDRRGQEPIARETP